MKTELQTANPSVFVLLEIDFPSGTKRYSKYGVSSATLGPYESRVVSFGRLGRSASSRDNTLQIPQAQAVLADEDYQFAKILGRGERIQNSAVRIKLASANVSTSNWYTAFTGRLLSWTNPAQCQWTLTFRAKDLPLTAQRPTTTITKYDWPDAPTDSLNSYVPIVYGRHDSSGETNTGALPTIYVDNVGFRYVVSIGYMTSVDRVYKDGTRQTTGFSITNPLVGGRRWTVIDFTSDQGTSSITCDGLGYGTAGDGTDTNTTFMADPSDQLKHFLVNFIFNEYQSGAWFADSTAPIDTTSFAAVKTFWATRAAGGPYVGGRYIAEQTTGMAELNNWCKSYEIRCYYTPSGNVAIKADDPNSPTAYISDPWIRYPQDELENSFRQTYDEEPLNLVTSQYSNQATGSYFFSQIVSDPLSSIDASETISMIWGPHFE